MANDRSTSDRDMSLMSLGFFETLCLFLLYAASMVLSVHHIFKVLTGLNASEIMSEAQILGLLGASAVGGASIAYARKLYKAGINEDYNFSPVKWTVPRLATAAFYVLRLPISVIISLVLYGLWRLSIEIAQGSQFSPSPSSQYLFIVMGFFAGFSAGRFLEYFERDGVRLSQSNVDQK